MDSSLVFECYRGMEGGFEVPLGRTIRVDMPSDSDEVRTAVLKGEKNDLCLTRTWISTHTHRTPAAIRFILKMQCKGFKGV